MKMLEHNYSSFFNHLFRYLCYFQIICKHNIIYNINNILSSGKYHIMDPKHDKILAKYC